MKYRAKRDTRIFKYGKPIKIGNGGVIEIDEHDFEPLTDTPEQPVSGECEHEEGGKEEHDHLGTYHVGSETCCKCGAHMNDWEQPVSGEHELLLPYFGGEVPEELQQRVKAITSPEQPTQEIERVPLNELYRQQGYGEKYDVKDVAHKLDEVIAAVNALQKGEK